MSSTQDDTLPASLPGSGSSGGDDRIAASDFEVTASTPAEFGDFIRAETAKWTKVVKASGARAD